MPADAFYEWTGKPGAKRPHMISRAGGPGVLAFAGLWEHWMGADGSELESMAIVTVAANGTLSAIHDRMPAILPETAFNAWLDTRNVRDHEVYDWLKPAADDLLQIEELLPAINSSRREGAELQTRVGPHSVPGGTGTLL